jgi:hypothetical protein
MWAGRLAVVEAAPRIMSFAVAPNPIPACQAVRPTLTWRVENARRIRLLRDGTEMVEKIRNPECGVWQESFTDPDGQNEGAAYTLEAYPPSGGAMQKQDVIASAASPLARVNDVTLNNVSGLRLHVWFVDLLATDALDQGELANGGQTTVTVPACLALRIVAVAREWVEDYNRRFGQNIDPAGKQAALTSNFWKWNWTVLGKEGVPDWPVWIA